MIALATQVRGFRFTKSFPRDKGLRDGGHKGDRKRREHAHSTGWTGAPRRGAEWGLLKEIPDPTHSRCEVGSRTT